MLKSLNDIELELGQFVSAYPIAEHLEHEVGILVGLDGDWIDTVYSNGCNEDYMGDRPEQIYVLSDEEIVIYSDRFEAVKNGIEYLKENLPHYIEEHKKYNRM